MAELAPRPINEKRRAQAVIRTGLISNPKPELFQIYCDLAKDLTGFDSATFSLYDDDIQCGISASGGTILKLAQPVTEMRTIFAPTFFISRAINHA